ncbi:MAG TPA: 30S ribosomal protein S16 [Candidatus Doudnabacteria bacterium]|nr:30S ribosomal protein S16 [Candidatus Doudnabacteria bacterium]
MLTIRLQRAGKRNTPQYKLVLAQRTAANQKQFVEMLGAYNPHTKELHIRSQDRLNYWMNEQHVPLSATVHNLFVTKEILKAEKTKAFTIPKKLPAAGEANPEQVTKETSQEAESAEAGETTASTEEVTSEVSLEETTTEPVSESEPSPAEAESAEPEKTE